MIIFSRFCWIVFCYLVNHWVASKQLFWIIHQLDHKIPCFQNWLLENYYFFLWWYVFLIVFILLIVLCCCFHSWSWSSRHLKSLLVAFILGYSVRWCCDYLGLLYLCMSILTPLFLLPLVTEFLNFYFLTGSYNSPGWLIKTSLLFSRRWCYS